MSRRGASSYTIHALPMGLEYGSATFNIVFESTLKRLYLRHSRGGGGGTQTGGFALVYHLPYSFQRWLAGPVIITRRSGTTTSFLARLYNDAGTVDPAYTASGVTIRPSAADTWETFALPLPTGTYRAGERALLDLESILPGNTNHDYRDVSTDYSE